MSKLVLTLALGLVAWFATVTPHIDGARAAPAATTAKGKRARAAMRARVKAKAKKRAAQRKAKSRAASRTKRKATVTQRRAGRGKARSGQRTKRTVRARSSKRMATKRRTKRAGRKAAKRSARPTKAAGRRTKRTVARKRTTARKRTVAKTKRTVSKSTTKAPAPVETGPVEPALLLVTTRAMEEGRISTGKPWDCVPDRLKAVLGQIAERWGPVTINSTHRSRRHNRRVGGRPRSYHLRCRAVDFRVNAPTPGMVAWLKRHPMVGGYKRYRSGYYHIDTGPRRTW